MIHTRQTHSLAEIRCAEMVCPPTATERWKGLPHADLLDAIKAEAKRRDWKLDNFQSHFGEGKAIMAASFRLTDPGQPPLDVGSLSLGVYNSNSPNNDARLRFFGGVEIGNKTSVCFVEAPLSKHMISADLAEDVRVGCSYLAEEFKDFPVRINLLKGKYWPEGHADFLLLQACRRKLLPWSYLGAVDETYAKLESAGSGNGWGLLTAMSAVVCAHPYMRQMQRLLGLYRLLETR